MINNIVLQRLKEREKELNTLYRLGSLLSAPDLEPDAIFSELIKFLPMGFQYTTICESKVVFEGKSWESDDYRETPWRLTVDIVIDNHSSGEINIVYTQLIDDQHDNQFLPEEQMLISTIAGRLGNYFFQQRLKNSLKLLETGRENGNSGSVLESDADQHWKWRFSMAERISELMDMGGFGVKAIYLIGSTKNGTAGPASDIDLLIHHQADEKQLNCLRWWINGWSMCLAEVNQQRTGYQTPGLIDLHLISDEDIAKADSFAVMIGAVTDPARLLRKTGQS